jgi:hypothetical protein
MPKMTIDGQEYNTEDFSEEAKAQLLSLQVVDRKIAELNADIAIMQTARNAYAKALTELLPKVEQ